MRTNIGKKKIILFTDSLVRGGAQRQLVELATNLNRERFDVRIVIYHDIQQLRGDVDRAQVPVTLIEKKGRLDLKFFWRLYRFFRRERPDIVQSYLNTANLWARLAGSLAGVKYIITSERNIDIQHSRLRVFLERLLHPLSDAIVVNAAAIRELLIKRVHVPAEKIKVIYNGVNPANFQTATPEEVVAFREKYGLSVQNFVLVLPGRLQPQKNHLCLIEAVNESGGQALQWKILFVGNENDSLLKEQLLAKIATMELDDHFIFAGNQDNMGIVYSVADVIVLPSLWEGFPNVLLEAMSLGKVVVASDVADNKIIIDNGINGYIFHSDDSHDLCSKLLTLYEMSNKELTLMGTSGRKKITEEYSIKKMIDAYEYLYKD